MKYYIIAGEASGDLHGSNLIREIKKKDADAEIRGWGGSLMQQAGAEIVKDYRDLAFMGFTEVIRNLPTILKNIKFCKSDILLFKPDPVIFIDYPGFNLRMAEWARKMGYKTIYYISPQVWAWKESRVKNIRENIDKMLVILPFEKAFFQKWNYETTYVGHPLVEVIERFKKSPEAAKLPEIYMAGGISDSVFPATDCFIARKPKTGNIKKTACDAGSQPGFPGISVCSGRSSRTGFCFL